MELYSKKNLKYWSDTLKYSVRMYNSIEIKYSADSYLSAFCLNRLYGQNAVNATFKCLTEHQLSQKFYFQANKQNERFSLCIEESFLAKKMTKIIRN